MLASGASAAYMFGNHSETQTQIADDDNPCTLRCFCYLILDLA